MWAATGTVEHLVKAAVERFVANLDFCRHCRRYSSSPQFRSFCRYGRRHCCRHCCRSIAAHVLSRLFGFFHVHFLCYCSSVVAGLREIHISGDIAYATRQYWYATQDMDWLTAVGSDLVSGIADFYLSRSTVNANGGLSINDVIPPDE